MQGRCTCGQVRYHLTDVPLFTHACHCTWCQRETGGPHALNAMIETDRLQVAGAVERVLTPSSSGKGQEIVRCPTCKVALYSHYAGAGRVMAFVRVGTMDDPAACPPDVHIFTASRLPWYVLPQGIPAVPAFYDRKVLWPDWALARRAAALGE